MGHADAQALVDLVLERLGESYIFPGRLAEAAKLLRTRLATGAYEVPGPELCRRISDDLFATFNDKHLRLIWHESVCESRSEAELVSALREHIRRDNFGIRRLERLPGNVGFIELTIIPEPSAGAASLAAAMRLVEHTTGLIIDLRPTLGGSPDGVAFFASFFFQGAEARLSDFIEGPHGPARQYWTAAYVPGPRYVDRPVYLLTSSTTFSGGEALAYDLKALGRVTIVGETTRGGAHPSEVVSLIDQVELRLPVARSVNPATGGNWEGSGVTPHVLAESAAAFRIAYRSILESITADLALPLAERAEARETLDDLLAPQAVAGPRAGLTTE